jgi:uncharacterized protein (DUF1786 family)
MQVLAVDVGTGTQDIYLFQQGVSPENGFKLVMPSPTMMVRRQVQRATEMGRTLLLQGVTMGGGPSHWAVEAHVKSGLKVFATPEAARTFNDDLGWVQREMGLEIVTHAEAKKLRDVERLTLRDFDYEQISAAFATFGIELDPAAVAVAVFDHGNAPPNYSDRQFRFDYLNQRIQQINQLSAFAFLAADIPPIMTRMQAVAETATGFEAPLIVMDTAPAAVLGATLDPDVAARERSMIVNVGNFHTLAFRLGPTGIEGVFEHHTGLLNAGRLDDFLTAFAVGTLTHEAVFKDHGHGALIQYDQPLKLDEDEFQVAVTGPRRAMMHESSLRTHMAVPFGDMMIAGCFGMLRATADLLPDLAEVILEALGGSQAQQAPWDVA